MMAGAFLLPLTARARQVPTAESIIARHDSALGGRKTLDTHSSAKLTGTVDIASAGLRGTIEVLRAKPNRFVQRISLNRVGELLKGFDGTVAWQLEPSGAALLTDADAEILQAEADWYQEFHVPQALRGSRVDSAEFDGRAAWQLTYASALGVEVHAYFDRDTGLRIGESWSGTVGDMTMTQWDYRVFGGVRIPTRVTNRSRIGEMIITIESVEFDHLATDAFALPPAVKALIRK
jgi:hypothetical protein